MREKPGIRDSMETYMDGEAVKDEDGGSFSFGSGGLEAEKRLVRLCSVILNSRGSSANSDPTLNSVPTADLPLPIRAALAEEKVRHLQEKCRILDVQSHMWESVHSVLRHLEQKARILEEENAELRRESLSKCKQRVVQSAEKSLDSSASSASSTPPIAAEECFRPQKRGFGSLADEPAAPDGSEDPQEDPELTQSPRRMYARKAYVAGKSDPPSQVGAWPDGPFVEISSDTAESQEDIKPITKLPDLSVVPSAPLATPVSMVKPASARTGGVFPTLSRTSETPSKPSAGEPQHKSVSGSQEMFEKFISMAGKGMEMRGPKWQDTPSSPISEPENPQTRRAPCRPVNSSEMAKRVRRGAAGRNGGQMASTPPEFWKPEAGLMD